MSFCAICEVDMHDLEAFYTLVEVSPNGEYPEDTYHFCSSKCIRVWFD